VKKLIKLMSLTLGLSLLIGFVHAEQQKLDSKTAQLKPFFRFKYKNDLRNNWIINYPNVLYVSGNKIKSSDDKNIFGNIFSKNIYGSNGYIITLNSNEIRIYKKGKFPNKIYWKKLSGNKIEDILINDKYIVTRQQGAWFSGYSLIKKKPEWTKFVEPMPYMAEKYSEYVIYTHALGFYGSDGYDIYISFDGKSIVRPNTPFVYNGLNNEYISIGELYNSVKNDRNTYQFIKYDMNLNKKSETEVYFQARKNCISSPEKVPPVSFEEMTQARSLTILYYNDDYIWVPAYDSCGEYIVGISLKNQPYIYLKEINAKKMKMSFIEELQLSKDIIFKKKIGNKMVFIYKNGEFIYAFDDGKIERSDKILPVQISCGEYVGNSQVLDYQDGIVALSECTSKDNIVTVAFYKLF
jgi:hypothetical protein